MPGGGAIPGGGGGGGGTIPGGNSLLYGPPWCCPGGIGGGGPDMVLRSCGGGDRERERRIPTHTHTWRITTTSYILPNALAHSCLYHLSPSQAPSTSTPNPPLCKSHSIKMSFLRYKSNGGEFDLFFTWYIQRVVLFSYKWLTFLFMQ